MNPSEDALRRLVREWVKKADVDFDVAGRLLEEGARFREVIAFHAQQAVEKHLKALLVRHQVEFPKTHDIEELLNLLRRVRPEIADSLQEARWLTPFGVEVRYPGDFPDMLPGEERKAFELARHVKETVMAELEAYLAGG